MSELSWRPPEDYYQDIATSEVNPFIHWAGRKLLGVAVDIRFGQPTVVASEGLQEADLTAGNVIISATHRHLIDTVTFPDAIESIGVHHARPVSKIELFQKAIPRWVLHRLGAFCVDRDNADLEGLALAQKGILERGGSLTVYGEGTRVDEDVLTVQKLKSGLVITAAANNSTIVPAAVAGLSVEKTGKKPNRRTVARDSRSWFGKGPGLVFAFGDPMKVDIPHPEAGLRELSRAELREKSEAIRSESERVRVAMQQQLDLAYLIRGESLDDLSSE